MTSGSSLGYSTFNNNIRENPYFINDAFLNKISLFTTNYGFIANPCPESELRKFQEYIQEERNKCDKGDKIARRIILSELQALDYMEGCIFFRNTDTSEKYIYANRDVTTGRKLKKFYLYEYPIKVTCTEHCYNCLFYWWR